MADSTRPPYYDPTVLRKKREGEGKPLRAYAIPVVQWTIASVMFWKYDKRKTQSGKQ